MTLKKVRESAELLPISQTTCFFHLGGFITPLHNLVHGGTGVFLAPEDLDPDIGLMLDVAAKTKATSILCGSHHLIQVTAPLFATLTLMPFFLSL